MAESFGLRAFLLIGMLTWIGSTQGQWYGGNQCIGSGCYCTKTPTTITCVNQNPMNVRPMIRGSATFMSLTDSRLNNLLKLDLHVFYNIEELYININKTGVCQWISDKSTQFSHIKITRRKNTCAIAPPHTRDRKDGTPTDYYTYDGQNPDSTSPRLTDEVQDGSSIDDYIDGGQNKNSDKKHEEISQSSAGEIVGYIIMMIIIGVGVFITVAIIRFVL